VITEGREIFAVSCDKKRRRGRERENSSNNSITLLVEREEFSLESHV
jgi:hypothetical protein